MRATQAGVVTVLSVASLMFSAGVRAAPPPQATQRPASAPTASPDPQQGKAAFEVNCSRCHGMDGSGIDGPDIRHITSAIGDQAVSRTIRTGVPGTGMPAFGSLNEQTLAGLVAYIHTLAGVGAEPSKGDAANGKALFVSKGCSACHTIGGEGGDLGPELGRIGAMRGPQGLREAITNPGLNLPQEGNTADRGRFTQYLMFKAVTKEGHTVEGMRVGESSFEIALRDSSGNFQTLDKLDLKSLDQEPGKSFMPSFKGTLSETELDDLVAYLSSLRGQE